MILFYQDVIETPENILNLYYNNKSDIWVVGCLIYELFKNPLFNLDNFKGKTFEKDRYHMSLMFDLLGKKPKELALNSELSEDIFDNKGRILKNKEIVPRDLRKELSERIILQEDESEKIYKLLKRILVTIILQDLILELLEDEWYRKCD